MSGKGLSLTWKPSKVGGSIKGWLNTFRWGIPDSGGEQQAKKGTRLRKKTREESKTSHICIAGENVSGVRYPIGPCVSEKWEFETNSAVLEREQLRKRKKT